MGATTSKGWEEAFDNWPGWRGNDPIRQAFQAGWEAALASHAPSDSKCGEEFIDQFGNKNTCIRTDKHECHIGRLPSEAAAQPKEYPEDMDQMMGSQRWRYKEK